MSLECKAEDMFDSLDKEEEQEIRELKVEDGKLKQLLDIFLSSEIDNKKRIIKRILEGILSPRNKCIYRYGSITKEN